MRSFFIILAIFIETAVYAIVAMLHMFLWRNDETFYAFTRSWARLTLRIAGIHVSAIGAENIRPGERYVYVSNHASLFDIPVIIASVPDNIRIMYKRQLARIPIFGWCVRMSPFIAIDRERSRDASDVLESIVATMSSGSSVLVFPEGTRSENGEVGAFRRGAFVLALRSGKPLVPLSLLGTATILPKNTRRVQGGKVFVRIGPPIHAPEFSTREQEKEMMANVRQIIVNNVNLPS